MTSPIGSPPWNTVWTVGHSTRPWEVFLSVLAAHGIQAIADVRRFPGSRRYPWFASETLATQLPAEGIAYRWLPQLGGRRRAQPGSPNGGWRNAAVGAVTALPGAPCGIGLGSVGSLNLRNTLSRLARYLRLSPMQQSL